MSDNGREWIPENIRQAAQIERYDEPMEKLLRETDRVLHVEQRYSTPLPAHILQCTVCGATTFEIGVASYFTAIRCMTCNWELCIHQG